MNSILEYGYFKLARNISKFSDHRVKVGCVIANKKPISAASNKDKTHPKYADPDHSVRSSTHAEVRAIINCGVEDLTGAIAYVYREYKDGRPGLAKPCNSCLDILRERGIKRVYYSIDWSSYGVIRL
jgi:pyrimidine deaminase RibD-like protein